MPPLDNDLVKSFVIAAHADLPTVQQMLSEHPDLLNVEYDWGPGGLESGIGAAAHVGNRAIAEFFLARGVPSNICVAAMLGRTDEVRQALNSDPTLANARGAHGIPVLFHAAMSGNVDVAGLLAAAGCREGYNFALHGAINFGHAEMVAWLLANGVTDITTPDFRNKTPLENAQELNHSAIIGLLKAYRAG